jgi:hypothetical protein
LSGADEVAWESWQLLIAICDEGDGLMLFLSNFFHKVMTAPPVVFTFKVSIVEISPQSNLR